MSMQESPERRPILSNSEVVLSSITRADNAKTLAPLDTSANHVMTGVGSTHWLVARSVARYSSSSIVRELAGYGAS